jgi:hypothetical protein
MRGDECERGDSHRFFRRVVATHTPLERNDRHFTRE